MYRYCNIITTGIDCHECAVVQVIGYIVVYAIVYAVVYTVVYVVVYVVPQLVLASPSRPITSLFHLYFICISSVFHLYFICISSLFHHLSPTLSIGTFVHPRIFA